MAFDSAAAGVVGGQREAHIAIVLIEQQTQVAHAALDVRLGLEDAPHVVHARRRRHQLHQSERALGRAGVGNEVRLGADHRLDQRRIDAMALRRVGDDRVERLAARLDPAPCGAGSTAEAAGLRGAQRW